MNSLSPEHSKLVDFITNAYPMPVKMASDIFGAILSGCHLGKGDFLLKEGSISNEYRFSDGWL